MEWNIERLHRSCIETVSVHQLEKKLYEFAIVASLSCHTARTYVWNFRMCFYVKQSECEFDIHTPEDKYVAICVGLCK